MIFEGAAMTADEAARWTPVGFRRPVNAVVYHTVGLFKAKSRYATRGSVGGQMIVDGRRTKLKNGVFIARDEPTGGDEELAEFHGVVIDDEKYAGLTDEQRGYCLAWTDDTSFLYCYDTCQAGACLASLANSAEFAIIDVDQLTRDAAIQVDVNGHQVEALANARIAYEEIGHAYRYTIRSNRPIWPGEEVLVTYAGPRAQRAGGIFAMVG